MKKEIALVPTEQLSQGAIDQPPLDNLNEIERWYRNISPIIDSREIGAENLEQAFMTTSLLLDHAELPQSREDVSREFLETATRSKNFFRRVAAEGETSLLLCDFATEYATCDDQDAATTRNMLRSALIVASEFRDSPITDKHDAISANSKLANVRIALLHVERESGRLQGDFSSQYISIVREEAQWLSQHADSPRGAMFEAYVGCLTKYQLWASEEEDRLVARHATKREDAPSRGREGGRGHEYAHDVVIGSKAFKAFIQCKYGKNAEEAEYRYDLDNMNFVSETGTEGILQATRDFRLATLALAHSSDIAQADICESLVKRYNIREAIDSVALGAPRVIGSVASTHGLKNI